MNKLGITFVEQCTKFAKGLGKSKVLPKSFPVSDTAGLRYSSNLTSDVVQLERKAPNDFFSSLEKDIINEIKSGQIENAKVIDKNGNLATDLKFIGDKYGVRLSEHIYEDGVLDKFIDATYIHNHPFNAPLSSNDIYQMALLKIKKMVACTSDGGYSLIQRTKQISEMNYEEFINASWKLISEEIEYIKSLGKKRGITDIQRMEMLNQWRYERFNVFANKFGLDFKNNISHINNESTIEGNLFYVNPLQRLIDKVIIKYRSMS